ncbi:hypothetical protein BDV38DRAFT_247029 [Aspergillus pseudotamarii]|uniref:Uncharacterized protein n=1 Tax=Aspergillus pseudotamarii TaxID=132259 RepID=A0A5N6STT6_ASPPS|nr:uncharacterized protein BDV38DRAFT_247029 [Aspergillus pseudotamarii]KAE8137297.1 hypothetical protein BDV38DRAFT_247029 [Aspergillus pseudotamarii]
MSPRQNPDSNSQEVKIDSGQTGPPKQDALNGDKSINIPRGSDDYTRNDSHTSPNATKQSNVHDNSDADWEIVSYVQDGKKDNDLPFHGRIGHFSIDVGWGKRKHRLYSSDWSFGHYHHHRHQCHADIHGEEGSKGRLTE